MTTISKHSNNQWFIRLRMRYLITICLLSCALYANAAISKDVSTQDAYDYIVVDPNTAKDGQLWPIEYVTNFNAQEGETLGAGIQRLLDFIGYQLDGAIRDKSFGAIFDYPIPPIHHSFEKNSIYTILESLVGPAFKVIVDPVSRVVSFDIDVSKLK